LGDTKDAARVEHNVSSRESSVTIIHAVKAVEDGKHPIASLIPFQPEYGASRI
jgi:hypothetical protein